MSTWSAVYHSGLEVIYRAVRQSVRLWEETRPYAACAMSVLSLCLGGACPARASSDRDDDEES